MKNKEKYVKEIVEFAIRNHSFGLNKKIREVFECKGSETCSRCSWKSGCCYDKRLTWANEEYKEPILDYVEKEYLRAVIKPFRDRVNYICKGNSETCNTECLYMNVKRIEEETEDEMIMPCFEKGTMYKGMKLIKKYTLEELGL